MKKENWMKLAFSGTFFIIAVLMVVGAIVPEEFHFGWLEGIVYLMAAWSVVCLVGAFVAKRKQGLLLVAWVFGVICLGVAIAIGLRWYLSIVLMVLYLGFIFVVKFFCYGGRSWDVGDNQKPGYEDYKTRKAREQAAREAQQAQKTDSLPGNGDSGNSAQSGESDESEH